MDEFEAEREGMRRMLDDVKTLQCVFAAKGRRCSRSERPKVTATLRCSARRRDEPTHRLRSRGGHRQVRPQWSSRSGQFVKIRTVEFSSSSSK